MRKNLIQRLVDRFRTAKSPLPLGTITFVDDSADAYSAHRIVVTPVPDGVSPELRAQLVGNNNQPIKEVVGTYTVTSIHKEE